MTDEKNKTENTFHKKIGKTNYKVKVHFSETSNETITDKINRLIQKECEDMSYKKDEEIS
ncbi:transposon-encoded TnpW family protein [Solobacterium moorei]|uniref:transposon-encoded TnpW family protein n=1 Tax=Solobacterium moorei TaxID=102148 RepID=UPI0023F0A407|nr:transposon-encoded TnpW family protein [Solobacterium moorei]